MSNKKNTVTWSVVAAMTLALTACGGGSDSGSSGGEPAPAGQNPSGGTVGKTAPGSSPQTQPVTCDSVWSLYTATNPAGLYEERKTFIDTELPGGQSQKSESLSKSKVLESSATHLKISKTVDQLSPVLRPGKEKISVMTKDDFMKVCSQGVPGLPNTGMPNGTGATVLDEADVNITVQAGTFAAKYRKMKVTIATGESIIESWTAAGSGSQTFDVKSVTVTAMKMGSTTLKTTTTTELVKRQL